MRRSASQAGYDYDAADDGTGKVQDHASTDTLRTLTGPRGFEF